MDLVTAGGAGARLGCNNPRHGPFHKIIYYNNRQLSNEVGFNTTRTLCACLWEYEKHAREEIRKYYSHYELLYVDEI